METIIGVIGGGIIGAITGYYFAKQSSKELQKTDSNLKEFINKELKELIKKDPDEANRLKTSLKEIVGENIYNKYFKD
jgi:gas vesicle protein